VKHNVIARICLVLAWIVLSVGVSAAQDKVDDASKKPNNVSDQPARFFDIKIPEGFKPENVEEAGILRWSKGDGEIYLAVADLFQNSGGDLFSSLLKAAEQHKRMESVRTLKLKMGKALFYKEKAPDDPARLRAWRLIVITDKKIINLDFSAPAKDFETYAPDFEQVVKSFKLKSPS
jgi:hypothetical protein